MTAAVNNLQIDQFADFTWQWLWQNPDGTPVNLTGYTAKMQIRPQPNAPPSWDSSSGPGGITLGGTSGTITLNIPEATIAAWTFQAAQYDIVVTSPSGAKTRVVFGSVSIVQGITQ